jgi:hypothetical protein
MSQLTPCLDARPTLASLARRISDSLRRLRLEVPEALYGRFLALDKDLEQLQAVAQQSQSPEPPQQVLPYLDLSTCHVQQSTMAWLEDAKPGFMSIANYDYGAFVTVPPTPDELAEDFGHYDEMPEDLATVLMRAQEMGCYLVRLDADGPTLEGLPTYDW